MLLSPKIRDHVNLAPYSLCKLDIRKAERTCVSCGAGAAAEAQAGVVTRNARETRLVGAGQASAPVPRPWKKQDNQTFVATNTFSTSDASRTSTSTISMQKMVWIGQKSIKISPE